MFEECTKVDALVEILNRQHGDAPEVAVVLGSGWKDRASGLLEDTDVVDLRGLDNWPSPKVQGHGSELVLGRLKGTSHRIGMCSGRVHSYEGYSAAELVRGVRTMVRWGTSHVLLLNAAGSLSEDRPAGSLMPFSDHINMSLPNPLQQGQNCGLGAQFMDLVDLYDPEWRAELLKRRPELQPGVYAGLSGPCYETPAEVRMLGQLGAHAVGMSTIPEAIAAKASGARVMAISMMTNLAAGIGGSRPNHEEVLETATAHAEMAADVLQAALLSVLS
ncbi:MAG: purine-nucleoside phosphorylase [Planctomycetota bacterium]